MEKRFALFKRILIKNEIGNFKFFMLFLLRFHLLYAEVRNVCFFLCFIYYNQDVRLFIDDSIGI
jgi:hypothetical protein